MKKQTLWTKNYTILTLASILGAAGGIAGGYAMSFLVYDETGSTLAAGLLIALRVFPQFLLPILVAPWMDRLPRKPFLVYGDLVGGIMYGLAGIYLLKHEFSYVGYLIFSLILSCIGAMDSLAFQSIFPKLIPAGFEEKGYTVSGMLYPVMNVLVMPLAAVLLDTIGVARILIIQGGCAVLAAFLENQIVIFEKKHKSEERKFGLSLWWCDFLDGFRYLKSEQGLMNLFTYMAVANGAAMGYGPILVAFFRVTPGFTPFLYSFFSAVEFLGRSLGGLFHYHVTIPKKRRFGFAFLVYQIYELMDMCLLWLPYPLMLLNRAVCGFLGINSATLREAAVQKYLPDEYRARVNAFQNGFTSAVGSVLALAVGAIGEVIDYRLTVSLAAGFTMLSCWMTVWRKRDDVRMIYDSEK